MCIFLIQLVNKSSALEDPFCESDFETANVKGISNLTRIPPTDSATYSKESWVNFDSWLVNSTFQGGVRLVPSGGWPDCLFKASKMTNFIFERNFDLDVTGDINKIYIDLNYQLYNGKITYYPETNGNYNSIHFIFNISIYNFSNQSWKVFHNYDNSENYKNRYFSGQVSSEINSDFIENGKIRLKLYNYNRDISCSALCIGTDPNCFSYDLRKIKFKYCYSNIEPSCDDGIKNQDEQGIDCGGSCQPCISCSNRIQDGDEEGVDCGGSCSEDCRQLKILALPLNWQGTQQEFDDAVNLQLDFFINSTELNDCREKIKIDKLDLPKNFVNFTCSMTDCGVQDIKPYVESLGVNVNIYDHIIGFIDHAQCGRTVGCSNKVETAWAYTAYEVVAAHEIGHFYGLSDEYCSNQAGSGNPKCNDGGEWWWDGIIPKRPKDINYLGSDLECDSHINGCCDDCSRSGDPSGLSDYFVCCEGNINDLGGRAIMSYADAPGPRAFDNRSKAHLNTFSRLQCTGAIQSMFTMLQSEVEDKIIDLDLLINKNNSVEKRWIHLVDGEPSILTNDEGTHSLLLKDINNNTIFNYTFYAFFYYDGPMVKGENYSGLNLDYYDLSLRINYDNRTHKMELTNGSDILFSEILDFCNQDSICNGSETYLSCWQDCRAWSLDALCINNSDKHCDPDCAEGIDPDCKFTIDLASGWNLISSPLNFTNLTQMFLPIQPYLDSMFTFNAEYQEFEEIDPYNLESQPDLKHGAWLKVTQDANLTIYGQDFTSTYIPLFTGWNLIGVPSLNALNISKWINASVVYGYNGSYYSYIPGRNNNMFEMAEPGNAYWVKKES